MLCEPRRRLCRRALKTVENRRDFNRGAKEGKEGSAAHRKTLNKKTRLSRKMGGHRKGETHHGKGRPPNCWRPASGTGKKQGSWHQGSALRKGEVGEGKVSQRRRKFAKLCEIRQRTKGGERPLSKGVLEGKPGQWYQTCQ